MNVVSGFDQVTSRKIEHLAGLMTDLIPAFDKRFGSGCLQFHSIKQDAGRDVQTQVQDGAVIVELNAQKIPETHMQAMAWFLSTLASTHNGIVWECIHDFPAAARENLDLLSRAHRKWQAEFKSSVH